jgi:hypothetical protein
MKKNSTKLLILVLTIVIALSFAACGGGGANYDAFKDNIANIETYQMNSNGVAVTNYAPVLSDKIDWLTADEETRIGTARYAVTTVISQAQEAGVENFTILGYTTDRQPAFIYAIDANTDGTIQLYGDGGIPAGEPITLVEKD